MAAPPEEWCQVSCQCSRYVSWRPGCPSLEGGPEGIRGGVKGQGSLTGILATQLLHVDVGSTVGVGADEDGWFSEEGQQQDALPQSAGLAAAKWTQHQ